VTAAKIALTGSSSSIIDGGGGQQRCFLMEVVGRGI
jgi:hypothetical protein